MKAASPPAGSRTLNLGPTEKVRPLAAAVRRMVRDEIMPLEADYEAEVGKAADRFKPTQRLMEIREGLKAKAQERGLWNFWLTGSDKGFGLTTVEYAYLAEEMGWSALAPEVFNVLIASIMVTFWKYLMHYTVLYLYYVLNSLLHHLLSHYMSNIDS